MGSKKDKAKDSVKVNLILDTRRKKQNGKYPVKIRVYSGQLKKVRLYTTDFDLTEETFQRIIFPEPGQRLKKVESEAKEHLEELVRLYREKVKSLNFFTFELFESSLIVKSDEFNNIFFHYQKYLAEMKKAGRLSTALTYELSEKSLKSFLKFRKGKDVDSLLFQEITVDFLNSYEFWMISKGKSLTTIGIYLRGLRVIFNRGIEEKIVDRDFYPFGLRKYEIPSTANKKKALSSNQLSQLFEAVPKNEFQEKAKDFWFFSFVCNGMNIQDIVNLKWANLSDNQIHFVREKTRRTKKSKQKMISASLNEFALNVISKYGNQDKSPSGFIFPIINVGMSIEEKDKKRRSFTRFINQHIKKLATENGISGEISTYWARHSFATSAIRNNGSTEFVKEALGHSNSKTTEAYLAGFEEETKKEMMRKITGFMD